MRLRTITTNTLRGAVLCVCVMAAVAPCSSAENRQQVQQALLKAQSLLKQVAQQKAQAEAELAKLRGELAGKDRALQRSTSEVEAQKAALAQAEAGLSAAGRRSDALSGSLAKTQMRLEQTTAKLREVAGMYRETRAKLQQAEAARDDLAAQLAETSRQLQDAEDKNLALYKVNRELMVRYQRKSAWDALRQAEPFSGIRGVAIENELQDYEDRMYEQLREVNVEAAEQ